VLQTLAPPARAQTASDDPGDVLRRAEVTYLEGDYETAVGMLEPLLKRSDLKKEQLAKTHELLAYCYDALDKEDKIKENVRALLEMNRKYPMKSEWMADRMHRIVNEVQMDLAKQDSAKAVQGQPEQRVEEKKKEPDHLTAEEGGKKGGSKKFLIFGAIGAAVVGGVVLLAGGGGGDEAVEPLPGPPPTPTSTNKK
jgi:lipopolysaccharide biosynthesis regulator YciM